MSIEYAPAANSTAVVPAAVSFTRVVPGEADFTDIDESMVDMIDLCPWKEQAYPDAGQQFGDDIASDPLEGEKGYEEN